MKRQQLAAGLACVVLGLVGAGAMFLRPEALRVPAWVGFSAMGAFVAAGSTLIANARAATKLAAWLGVATVAGLIVPPMWIALGPGPLNCTVSVPFLTTAAADSTCRVAFGLGALLGLVILVLALRRALRHGA